MTDGVLTAEARLEQIRLAEEEVKALCDGKVWRMRVPAYEDDSDIVIGKALQAARECEAELSRWRSAHGNREADCLQVVRSELKAQEAYAVSTEPHAGFSTPQEHRHTAGVLRVMLDLLELKAQLAQGSEQEGPT
jgi:hypothetical protein